MLIVFILAALAYGAALYGFGTELDQVGKLRKPAQRMLALAGVLHFIYIGSQCIQGHHPLESVFSVISLGAFLALVGYFFVSRKRSVDSLGALLAPVGLLSLALDAMFGATVHPRGLDSSLLAKIHIGLATIGLAGFTLAAGVAGVYLGMERRLRTKQFKPQNQGMSLTGLDRLQYRIVLLVTPIFTLAIVTGVVWLIKLGGLDKLGSRWFEILVGLVAWFASMSLLLLRVGLGMRGRKSARLTLVAFVCTVAVIAYYGIRV